MGYAYTKITAGIYVHWKISRLLNWSNPTLAGVPVWLVV